MQVEVKGNKHPSCHPDMLGKVRLKQKIKETKGKSYVPFRGKFRFSFIFIFLAAALDYVRDHPQDPINQKQFDEACGVGVVVTPEQIENAVSASARAGKKYHVVHRFY